MYMAAIWNQEEEEEEKDSFRSLETNLNYSKTVEIANLNYSKHTKLIWHFINIEATTRTKNHIYILNKHEALKKTCKALHIHTHAFIANIQIELN